MDKHSRRWPQRLIWFTLVVFGLFVCARLYYRLTDDFRITNITYEMPYRSEWEVSPLTPIQEIALMAVFDQPFYYVGKGAQSYVFVSQDHQYVIKFFKFKHLRPISWMKVLPSIPVVNRYRERSIARKKRLVNSIFFGYKLAYDVLSVETGLVFVHLNKTSDLLKTVILFDKIGRKWEIDLDSSVFVIQKRADITRNVMEAALERGDLSSAKLHITQIFDLYLKEYSKGIYDRDHGVMHNTGFIDGQPRHLDVGKLTKNPDMQKLENYRPDLEKIAKKYEVWLRNGYSNEYKELTQYIEEKLSEIFGEEFQFART